MNELTNKKMKSTLLGKDCFFYVMCDFRIVVKKTSNQWSRVSKTRILEPSLRQGVSRNPEVLTFLYPFVGIILW